MSDQEILDVLHQLTPESREILERLLVRLNRVERKSGERRSCLFPLVAPGNIPGNSPPGEIL